MIYTVSTLFGEEVLEHVKTCIKCGETKSIFDFAARTAKDQFRIGAERRNECCDCKSELGRVTRKLHKLWTKPSDVVICSNCDRHESEFKYRWALDHDHETDKARGFICDDCNNLLGCARDNIDVLKRSIAYLEQGGNLHLMYPSLGEENDYEREIAEPHRAPERETSRSG